MKEEITSKKLRSFGLTVGGVFTLIALWPAIARHDEPRWWIAAIAAFFLFAGPDISQKPPVGP